MSTGYKHSGGWLKVNGEAAVHEDCCCPGKCDCEPCAPLSACLIASTCRSNNQKIPLSPRNPTALGYCREYYGSATLNCCGKTLEIIIRWENNASSYEDIKIFWRYDGGTQFEGNASPSDCDPFDMLFENIGINDPACCNELYTVRVHCLEDDCYCPQFLTTINGTFFDKINACAIDGQIVNFVEACFDPDQECRRLEAKCVTISGCSDQIDLSLVWPLGGTDATDVDLEYSINGGPITTVSADPSSTCDPLCIKFKNISLPAACCSNTVELHIGTCVDCCCPQFTSPGVSTLNVTISGSNGLTGSGTISDSEGPSSGNCASWGTGRDPGDGIPVSGDPNCAYQEIGIELYCPTDSANPADVRLNVIDTEGIFICPAPTGVIPDSSSCGPPFTAQFTVDMTDEFCDCGIVTITVTQPGSFLSLGGGPTIEELNLPEGVKDWLDSQG